MSYDPNVGPDGHRHELLEHRPGYFECRHCRHRYILRAILPNGTTPTEADIKWINHEDRPST